MATTYNLEILQGSSFNILLTAKDQNGTPINLSGYNLRGYVKNLYSNTGYLINLSPTIYSSTGGIIQINLSGSQTALLPITQAVYDLEGATTGETSVVKFIRGYANITPEVSNF